MHVRNIATVLVVLLSTSAFAGCVDETPDVDDDPGAPGTDGATSVPFSLFLCTDGYVAANGIVGAMDRCNHRVTKPLVDANMFDWQNQHGPGNEVSIAVNPTNPLNAASGAKDYTVSYISDVADCGEYTVWMGTFWTMDGGITWGNDLMPGFPGDDRPSPLAGNLCNTDPVLVFDDDGTLWYSGLNYGGGRDDLSTVPDPVGGSDLLTGSQLYFAKSTDGGATYPDIAFAAAGDNNVIFNDKQWFALQPGGDHMIATWSQFAPVNDVIVYTESLDGGATWTPEKPFRPGGGTAGAVGVPVGGQFSMAQYLPGSAPTDLAVIWWDGASVLYAEGVVTPAGTEFGPIQSTFPVNSLKSGANRDGTGPSTYRLSTYPVLAVDTSGGACDGRRYVVWPDQPGDVDTDVQSLLRFSDDGLSWSEPVAINDVADGDQLMPWIDVDPDGGVHVAWYDKRNDPDNLLLDVYYAYSQDCGVTFLPNVRVTEVSFDGDLGHHQNGAPFIGDYIGIDTTAVSAHIIWADTRHTGEAGRLTGSDVYAATILKDVGAQAVFDVVFG